MKCLEIYLCLLVCVGSMAAQEQINGIMGLSSPSTGSFSVNVVPCLPLFKARIDQCVLGFAQDPAHCKQNATTGQVGSALIYRNQSTDPLPFAQLAPANTFWTDRDFGAYSGWVTDTALATTEGISGGAIFNLGEGGRFWAKDNSLLLISTGSGTAALLYINVALVHAKGCSPATPCAQWTGIRSSGSTMDATHFSSNGLAMSQVPADPANTIFELDGTGLIVNKLTVNGLPACAATHSCTLTRGAYVNFSSNTPVNCSVLPSDYQSLWSGLFNPSIDGTIGLGEGGAGDWHATTATVTPDDFILPTVNNAGNFAFQTTTSGTSAGSAPSWCQTSGCTTTDGTAVRTNIGKVSGQGPGFDLLVYNPAKGCSHLNTRLGKIYRGVGNADPAGTLTTDSVSSCWNLYGSLTIPCALTDRGTLHDAHMSLNSTYLIWGPTGGGSAPNAPFVGFQSARSQSGGEAYPYNYIWQVDTTIVRPMQQWTNQTSIGGSNVIGHSDAHGIDGQKTRWAGGAFFAHQFGNPNTSTGAPNPGTVLFPIAMTWDQHVSYNAADANDTVPALMAMTQPGDGCNNYSLAGCDEDVYIKTDGSGIFYRVTHNYDSNSSPDFSVQNAFGVTSPDNSFMAVVSDGMQTRGSITSPASPCPFLRANAKWSASTVFATGIKVLPISNNQNQSIFVNNGGTGTSGTTGNFSTCQSLSSTCSDGGITWTNLGPNQCRGDVFIVDTLSAHPLP